MTVGFILLRMKSWKWLLPWCQGQGGSALNDEEKKMIEEEFDFEANLAKFDKERTMQEIEDNEANEPDVVRLHQR